MSDFLKNLFDLQGKNRWAIARTSVRERIEKLQRLRKAIVKRQQEFYDAVWKDFHKPQTEAWLTEVFRLFKKSTTP
jgi:aldehyde dehydrogenase (NAD+)